MISRGDWGIGYLAGTGVSLIVIIVWWFVIGGGADLTTFIGTVTGIILSLSLVYLAYWLTQSELRDEHIWAVSRWGAVGLAIPTVPIVALVALAAVGLRSALRVDPNVLINIAAASAVIGALFGAVTELERQHKRVLSLNQRNLVLNRVLRHDVRNDAGMLLVFAERLEEEFSAAGEEFAEPIRRKTQEIVQRSDAARRVEDLDHDVTSVPVDVVGIVEEQVETIRSTRQDVDIEVDLPEEAWANADDLLATVIDNIVENAIEHNDGEPTVRISVDTLGPGDGSVRISVADDGPGMPVETARALSEGDRSGSDDSLHGAGLGLWLVRWFVDAYDGDLAIEENEPRGTVVRITLPRAASRDDRTPTGSPA